MLKLLWKYCFYVCWETWRNCKTDASGFIGELEAKIRSKCLKKMYWYTMGNKRMSEEHNAKIKKNKAKNKGNESW